MGSRWRRAFEVLLPSLGAVALAIASPVVPAQWAWHQWIASAVLLATTVTLVVLDIQNPTLRPDPLLSRPRLNDIPPKYRARVLADVNRDWVNGHLRKRQQELSGLDVPLSVVLPGEPRPPAQEEERIRVKGFSALRSLIEYSRGPVVLTGGVGAGKTLVALEFADLWLRDARETESAPMPVVFRLSSWNTGPGGGHPSFELRDWLAAEMESQHSVPRNVAEVWLEHGWITPILDDFDQVAPAIRPQCAEVIRSYTREHPGPVIVCGTGASYEQVAEVLGADIRINVEPLPASDVESALDRAGALVAPLQNALAQAPELRTLLSVPLLLHVAVKLGRDFPGLADDTPRNVEAWRRALLHEYVGKVETNSSQPEELEWVAAIMTLNRVNTFRLADVAAYMHWDGARGAFARWIFPALVWAAVPFSAATLPSPGETGWVFIVAATAGAIAFVLWFAYYGSLDSDERPAVGPSQTISRIDPLAHPRRSLATVGWGAALFVAATTLSDASLWICAATFIAYSFWRTGGTAARILVFLALPGLFTGPWTAVSLVLGLMAAVAFHEKIGSPARQVWSSKAKVALIRSLISDPIAAALPPAIIVAVAATAMALRSSSWGASMSIFVGAGAVVMLTPALWRVLARFFLKLEGRHLRRASRALRNAGDQGVMVKEPTGFSFAHRSFQEALVDAHVQRLSEEVGPATHISRRGSRRRKREVLALIDVLLWRESSDVPNPSIAAWSAAQTLAEHSPRDADILRAKGEALLGLRRPAEAIEFLNQSVGDGRGDCRSRLTIGRALFSLGKSAEAAEALASADSETCRHGGGTNRGEFLESGLHIVGGMRLAAVAQYRAANYKQALQILDELIAKVDRRRMLFVDTREEPWLRRWRALALIGLGEVPQALEEIDRAIAIHGEGGKTALGDLLVARALVLYSANERVHACNELDRAMRSYSNDVTVDHQLLEIAKGLRSSFACEESET